MKGGDDELLVSQLSSSCNEISGNSIQVPVSKYSWTASRSCRSLVKMKYLLSRRLRPADSAVPYFHQVRLAASGLIFKDFLLNIKKLHKVVNLILHCLYDLAVVSVYIFHYGTQPFKGIRLLFICHHLCFKVNIIKPLWTAV